MDSSKPLQDRRGLSAPVPALFQGSLPTDSSSTWATWLMLPLLIVALLGLGCASTSPPPSQPSEKPATQQTTAATTPLETARPLYAGPWEEPGNPLYQRTIYFDYDNAEIRPEYVPILKTHARYLGTNMSTRAILEGHTDERGTREYNLALGDQRADAVRRYLVADGVPPNQLSTLSYGEERPAQPGHNEQAWRLNRRVIIQYEGSAR